jgi:PAS domain S-box-containing protein
MNIFKKISVKTINAILIFSITLVFLIVSYLSYQTLLKIDVDENQVIHSYKVITSINTLISDLENMETGQRGYVITGQKNFLEPYNTYSSDVDKTFKILQNLTIDNSIQQQNLSKVKILIDAKVADLQNSILLRTNSGFNAALADVLTNKGKQIMDSIRLIVINMQTEESILLQLRTDDLIKINATAGTVIIWGSIIGFIFYLLINYIISKFVIGEIVQKPLLEKEKAALFYARSLLEASLDPLVTINPDGKITDVNEAVIKVTGISRDLIINTDFSEYFTEPEKAREGYKQAFKLGFVTDYPLTIKSKEGNLTDVLYNASLYKDEKGNVLGVFAAARDYTVAKRAKEEALKASKEMEAFSYSVSHDLRAPLRAIDGFTQILVEDHAEKLDDEGKRVASIIRASTVQMGKLIDDLLSFSRLGRQAIVKNVVVMNTLVNEIINELKKTAPKRDIEFIVKDIPNAMADINMMRVALMNLLANAFKFTSKKTKAVIEIGSKNENNNITYYIKDNGVGFDMKYIDKLFGVFQRLHSTEDFEGTGIGLSNVKRVIERHGGKVWAESKVGEGATFYFTLPKV